MRWSVAVLFATVGLVGAAAQESTAGFIQTAGGPDFDRGVFVTPMRDGGYVATGVSRSFGEGDDDIYLVRTDGAGNVLWSRTYGGAGTDNGWSVQESGDGLVLAGFTDSNGAGGFDCYLAETDAAGEPRWSTTFGGTGSDRCWGMVPLAAGGFALVGETAEPDGPEDCYLIRTDGAGRELWSRTFGGEQSDRCFSVAAAPDGGFAVAGQTYSEGAGDRDAWVVRTDASGNELWSQTFGGPQSDVAHFVARTADGGFLVTGYTTSFAENLDDPYLIKLDDEGRVEWTRVIAMPGINHAISGEQTADGGFILGGFTVLPESGMRSALLVKTDGEGAVEWSRDLLPTDDGESFGYTVRATPDGGAVLTGHTTVGSAGGPDLLLVKVDRTGGRE